MANVQMHPDPVAGNRPPAPLDPRMTKGKRFAIGGMGGLLPILASLITVDLAVITALVDKQDVTIGLCVGYALRIVCLFVLGGVVAALNSEVVNPMALVQIGIAAPALVTSYLSGAALMKGQEQAGLGDLFISPAYARQVGEERYEVAGGFLGDVINGTFPGLGRSAADLDRPIPLSEEAWPPVGEAEQPSATGPVNLVADQLPMAEIPGQPGIVNFIVVNNELQSCIPTPAPLYAEQQLIASFPPPAFTVTYGRCVIRPIEGD